MGRYSTTIDDMFLPIIFGAFISSLAGVFATHCSSKPSEVNTTQWKAARMGLYLLSAVSFLFQVKNSWMLDFLYQIDLVAEPILWQRLLEDFILAHKLTIDTTENYWITAQLLQFILAFVVFVNMYHKNMRLQLHHVFGYLILGLTGSYGGVFALFLVHFYNASSTSPIVAKFSMAQFIAQIISTVLGFVIVNYLYNASFLQVKEIILPFMVAAFLLPPVSLLFEEKIAKSCTKTHLHYFLISLGLVLTLHHFCVSCLLAYEWFSFDVIVLVAFGQPYQYAVSVDLISCIVISSIFLVAELSNLNMIEIKFGYLEATILKALVLFPCSVLVTFLISPGAILSFVLAYRERNGLK